MFDEQRIRTNWLDRVVLAAAVVVIAVGVLLCALVVSFDARINRAITETRLNRQVGCAGQLRTTGSTIPVCRTLGP